MSEALIRDLLAKDLSVLEQGLQLLNIEQYIPSTLGTRSFLDILARDRLGHWVIIEVKKTDAAAREAAHEVFKYAEAVQRHFGARADEIRVIVASVEWKELLVPFSRLKAGADIRVDGFRIELNANQTLIAAVAVEAVLVNQGRYLAPWHELNLYHDYDSLKRGVISYDKSCKEKGIEDYVLVVMRAAEDFYEKATRKLAVAFRQAGEMFDFDDVESGAEIDSFPLEKFEYILYFSPQVLSKEFCLSIIARDQGRYDEIVAVTKGMSQEAVLCNLHEAVYDVDPCPHRDYFEIGYAAKFGTKLLDEEGWIIERVIRRGTFERNGLLSDEAIIDELKGSTGSSGQSFRRTIDTTNVAHLSSARADLASALATNPGWLAQINRVLNDAVNDALVASAEISVFNPSSGVFTLYFLATEEDQARCMPRYVVSIRSVTGDVIKLYFGLLVPDGRPATLEEILAKYYDGRMGRLMWLASAGFYERRDADVMDDLGLVYRSFRLDDPDGTANWFELRDDRWKAFRPVLPFQPLQPYFNTNRTLIQSIVTEIGARMHAGFHDMS